LGIGLGWLATRGRSLWPAVIAHILYNAAILAATFFYAAVR
jgi:membrane protease YdiL (CAAX protease family)